MKIEWTKEQLEAINTRGKDIIVSASAGSGKTTIMIERILSLLEEGETLEQMLIVTFTNASTKDMKEKLALRLSQSNDKRIRSQLYKLPFLDISTLHSFCQKIIKTYFYILDIDPEFDILEDNERESLLSSAIKAVLEEEYQLFNEDYLELAEIYIDSNQDSRLKKLIINLLDASELNNGNLQIDSDNKYLCALNRIKDKTLNIFGKLKQAKSKLDFFDLEKLCLKILKSDLSTQIRESYKYIFVDEYQDINPLQNEIIDTLKSDNNYLFLVGDLKQSIYAFRGCEPSIFADKYEQYKIKQNCKVIELNANHRSCNEILSFSNEVFSLAMTNEFGGIDYKKSGSFILGRKKNEGIKIHFCPKRKRQFDSIYDITRAENEASNEAEKAVLCILDILSNKTITENGIERPVLYKDIAVLFRSSSDTVYRLVSILESLSIKTTYNLKGNKSVEALINFLKLINNSCSDSALINSLKSIFGLFTDNELAKIRTFTPRSEYFYLAVKNYSLNNSDLLKEKIDAFYDSVERYRNLSFTMSVSELAGKIVSDYEYFQHLFAYKGAEAVKLEGFLNSLCEYSSLYELLNSDYEFKGEESESDAINIMTVHSSKGLEFPYVLILDVQKRFNLSDLYSPVLICKNKVSIKDYDFENKTVTNTEDWLLNQSALNKRLKEEELRLLYVALTRAKYRVDIFVEREESAQENEKEHKASESSICWFDWLNPFVNNYTFNEYNNIELPLKKDIILPPFKQSLVDKLKERLNKKQEIVFKKPKSYVTALIHNEESENLEEIEQNKKQIIFSDDDRAITKGNLYHKAMELINFDYLDIEKEWLSLTEDIRQIVKKEDIIKCIQKIRPLLRGSKYYKEQPFIFKEDEMLIQGVIDLLIIDSNNEAIVLDYKTGNISSYYKKQLDYYALATERILGIKVKQSLIYSFKTNEIIDI